MRIQTIETIPLNAPDLCLPVDVSLAEALGRMLAGGVNHAPVCQDREWVGMLSMRDLVGGVLPEAARLGHASPHLGLSEDAVAQLFPALRDMAQRQVAELVRSDVPILQRDHRLADAALLIYQQAMPLPVLGSDGSFLGMLSPRALMRHLVELAGMGEGCH